MYICIYVCICLFAIDETGRLRLLPQTLLVVVASFLCERARVFSKNFLSAAVPQLPLPLQNFMAAQQRGSWGGREEHEGTVGQWRVQKGTGVSRATFTTTTHLSLWLPTQEGLAAAAAALPGGAGTGGQGEGAAYYFGSSNLFGAGVRSLDFELRFECRSSEARQCHDEDDDGDRILQLLLALTHTHRHTH